MGRRRDWDWTRPVALLLTHFAIAAILVVTCLAATAIVVAGSWLWHHRVEIATALRAWGIG